MRIYRERNPAPDASGQVLPPVEPATFTITCGAEDTLLVADG
jgi:hypothetical protein